MAAIETHEALLNDVVLQTIFKYLGYKDLKSCRELGNCQWLKNSKKAWWSQSNVRLTKRDGEANPILEYLNQTEINSNATNYKLDGIKKNYFGFWERFGHSIKELELSSCRLDSSDHFRHVIYTQCPNLEKLVVHSIRLKRKTDIVEPTEWMEPQFGHQNNLKCIHFENSVMPVSWMELLSHFPNIQFLKAVVYDVDLFKTISMIRQHDAKMMPNLKQIEIESRNVPLASDYDETIRSIFLDPRLSLETIRLEPGKFQPEILLDILDVHAKYLKKLILEDLGYRHPVLRYPRRPLQLLEELKITYCSFPVGIFKYTPNVTKVEIRLSSRLERVESSLQVNTCKDLRFYINEERDDSDFLVFLKAFPNVETLHTWKINNRRFSLICEHFTKLVSFSADFSTVNERGLLGFNPDSKSDAGLRNPNITNLMGKLFISTFLTVEGSEAKIVIDAGFVNVDLQSFSIEGEFFGIQMKNGSDVCEELKKLAQLRNFKLKDYKFQGDKKVWEEIFAKYSGH